MAKNMYLQYNCVHVWRPHQVRVLFSETRDSPMGFRAYGLQQPSRVPWPWTARNYLYSNHYSAVLEWRTQASTHALKFRQIMYGEQSNAMISDLSNPKHRPSRPSRPLCAVIYIWQPSNLQITSEISVLVSRSLLDVQNGTLDVTLSAARQPRFALQCIPCLIKRHGEALYNSFSSRG